MSSYIPSNDPYKSGSRNDQNSAHPLLSSSIDLNDDHDNDNDDEDGAQKESGARRGRTARNLKHVRGNKRNVREIIANVALGLWAVCTVFAAVEITVLRSRLGVAGRRFGFGEDWTGNVPFFPGYLTQLKQQHGYVINPLNTTAEAEKQMVQKWIHLMPDGKGPIILANSTTGQVPPGLWEPLKLDGYEYELSVFHQLACLYRIMKSYNASIRNETHVESDRHHEDISHCFDYLRQTIMCSSDVALEGRGSNASSSSSSSSSSAAGGGGGGHAAVHDEGKQHGKEDLVDGIGSRHVCRDYWAVKAWVEGVGQGGSKSVHDEGEQHGHR